MSHQNCCRYNKLPNLHFSICNADVAKLIDCKISNTRWTIRLVTWLCWIVFGDLPKKTQALCRSKIIISGFQRFSHWERGPGWTVQFSLQDKCHRWSDFIPYSHFCKFGSPLPQPAERWNKEWPTLVNSPFANFGNCEFQFNFSTFQENCLIVNWFISWIDSWWWIGKL